LLIEKKANVNVRRSGNGPTPLHYAAGNGHLQIVKLLVNNGAELDPDKQYHPTPLSSALGRSHFDVAEFLILAGADVNSRSPWDFDPLVKVAADRGASKLVRLMVKKGAKADTIPDDFPRNITTRVLPNQAASSSCKSFVLVAL
jgi:ankyrin repeat protein